MTLALRLTGSLIALCVVGACATDEPALPRRAHHRHHHGEGRPDGDLAGPVARARRRTVHQPDGRALSGRTTGSLSVRSVVSRRRNHRPRRPPDARREFHADAEAFFRQLDASHDGVIDAAEISAYEHAVPEIVAGFRPCRGQPQVRVGQGAGRRRPSRRRPAPRLRRLRRARRRRFEQPLAGSRPASDTKPQRRRLVQLPQHSRAGGLRRPQSQRASPWMSFWRPPTPDSMSCTPTRRAF